MKKNTLNKLLIAVCAIAILGSCKAKKLAEKTPTKTDSAVVTTDNSNAEKLKAFSAAQANYKTFSGRAKARIAMDGKDYDVTLNLRMANKEKIWASVTYIAGLEVARALITPDSIKILVKIPGQEKFISKPFSYIYNFTSEQVDFSMLESLFSGNYNAKFVSEQSTLKSENDHVLVEGKSADLFYAIIFGPNAKVSKTTLTNTQKAQSVIVSNDAFTQVSGRTFPANIRIDSKVKQKSIMLILNYQKIELDQNMQYPFSVPARYTRAD